MRGLERRKAQKRESILWAALELFKTYGFKKVSMNEIASKAGVNPVTIYNHFGSKDNLVREVVKTQSLDMLEKARQIMKQEIPFPEKLKTIVFDKVEILSQYHGEPLQTAIQSDPELRQFHESLWQKEINNLCIDILEKGKKEGYVSAEVTEEALRIYFEMLCRGASASSDILEGLSVELLRELNLLCIYGFVGNRG